MRRYEEPVEVRPAADGERPGSFLWHGRLYVVRDVLGHWRERRAWWASAAARAVHGVDAAGAGAPVVDGVPGGAGDGLPAEPDGEVRGPRVAVVPEREVWRVEASRGRAHGSGVFDLCREVVAEVGASGRSQPWRLVRVAD